MWCNDLLFVAVNRGQWKGKVRNKWIVGMDFWRRNKQRTWSDKAEGVFTCLEVGMENRLIEDSGKRIAQWFAFAKSITIAVYVKENEGFGKNWLVTCKV